MTKNEIKLLPYGDIMQCYSNLLLTRKFETSFNWLCHNEDESNLMGQVLPSHWDQNRSTSMGSDYLALLSIIQIHKFLRDHPSEEK